jgi:hypothetical protein
VLLKQRLLVALNVLCGYYHRALSLVSQILWPALVRAGFFRTVDILPALKDGDSSFETAMPRRENVPCRVDVAVM